MYCLPDGYQRGSYHYFGDLKNKDEWQDECYGLGEAILQLMQKNGNIKNPRILDIGCGSGYKLLKWFKNCSTLGLDVPRTVKWLKDKYPDRAWRESDFDADYGQFHIILAMDIIEHLEEPDNLLSLIARSLVHGGFCVLSTPDRDLLSGEYERPLGPPRNGAHVQEWNHTELQEYVKSAGFNVVFASHFAHNCQCLVLTAGSPHGKNSTQLGRRKRRVLCHRGSHQGQSPGLPLE